MASKTTTILPVRVENEILARLDALLQRKPEGATRTALAREALRRGLELIEADSSGGSSPKKAAAGSGERKDKRPRRVSSSQKGAGALELFSAELEGR